jgi:hypothetical protein
MSQCEEVSLLAAVHDRNTVRDTWKNLVYKADQSLSSSAEVKNMWIASHLMVCINCKGYLLSNDMRR